ncbi:hypothetical protein CRG98_031364 [Punica granatum]|uniref:Uncharacterized protein n=1 Tax=Punica granatum TaxID=22663 RepID=A0A2I0IW47_PUNGR|nr:hypothetical protein CRG98_031364 [Punica granatum]
MDIISGVAGIVGSIVGIIGIVFQCWGCTSMYRTYIEDLEGNLNTLEESMKELSGVMEEVRTQVVREDGEGRGQASEVGGWLGTVEALDNEVSEIVRVGRQLLEENGLCSGFPNNSWARYRQSKAAEAKERTVDKELGRGRIFKDVDNRPGDLKLKSSLEALEGKRKELDNVFEDAMERIRRDEAWHSKRTKEVGEWLKRVENLKEEVGEILEEGTQEMGGGDPQSHRNCPSCKRLSERAKEKTTALEGELAKYRAFNTYTYKPDDPPMVEQPLEPPVGLDSSFEEVWTWVQDESVRRIGLYGMGGVGKTTLLKKIQNKFLGIQHDYDVVAWIVVSQPTNPEKIQEHIWEKLHLSESRWNDIIETERPGHILKIMKEKNFLIFLDDIWEEIDLSNLGIPSRNHQRKSKIIFTTRLKEVCGSMQAERTKKVDCLPPNKALNLFREKVGEQTWTAHDEIPNLAEALIKECKYLPLSLITIGAAMASRRDPDEWRKAIEILKKLPSDFADIEKKVLSVLELSYKYLPNETHKKCFLYCSIFPEDHVYRMDDLIDLWIGEGLLNECNGIHEERDRGIEIARCLIRVCLLEEVDMSIEKRFKMHDVVRAMALWVASEHGKKKRPLCQEKQRSFEPTEFVKWTDVERISLWEVDQKLEKLPDTFATFSSLSTLIIRDTKVETFPNGFFSAMLSLTVLDVSCNKFLIELPGDIGVLGNLRYLDLRRTMIRELPAELENLTKLVFLLLHRYCRVPDRLISSLLSLRVFSWEPWETTPHIDGGEEQKVIEKLNHCCNTKLIQDVCLRLDFTVAVVKCQQLKKLPLKSSSSAHARRQFFKIRGQWEWWDGLQWDDPETKRLFFRNFISGF